MLADIAEKIQETFDAKDAAREEAYRRSREVVRACSAAIWGIHRGEFDEARALIESAARSLDEIKRTLAPHLDIYFGGFVEHAQQEYAEASIVYSVIRGENIPSPEDLGVEYAAYLGGLGDTVGELRRHALDLIREGHADDAFPFLDVMDEIYYTLMRFDYPDAITRGLRGKVDAARSLIERTRGDLVAAARR
ncbi:MAG TPA: hypothetical protein HA257_10415 [Candidatus Methanoperedenaceae archaeon]|nr:hypothetical protein [Candidatus Methanoperedenaceae archaeon]